MAEWYYTSSNQQKGPISWDELRQLAASGILQPTDLVWKEGMLDWLKASKKEGLFSDPNRARGEEQFAEEPLRRRPRDRGDRDDDFDDRPRRRRRSSEGLPLGAKVAIIGGSIAVGLLILVVIIVLLVSGSRNVQGGPGAYTITLAPGRNDVRFFRFNAGQNVRITVTTQAFLNNPDVDLYVERGNMHVASDTRVSKDCFVNFIAPVTDTYRVRVVNLGPGSATSTVMVQ